MRGFSVVGFLVGAICAIVLYAVGTALLALDDAGLESLLFAVAALLLWGYLTFRWPGERVP